MYSDTIINCWGKSKRILDRVLLHSKRLQVLRSHPLRPIQIPYFDNASLINSGGSLQGVVDDSDCNNTVPMTNHLDLKQFSIGVPSVYL
jgi:hypothetical protein